MKRFYSFVLALAGLGLGASAQSVVITETDGTTHKFCTDYIENITFEKIEVFEGVEFPTCTANPYSGGNVGLFFQAGTLSVSLDVYSSKTAGYLTPGTYKVDDSCGEMTVSTDPLYTKVIKELDEYSLKSGAMTVALDGDVYTIEMDFELSDASSLKGRWTGKLDKYGPVVPSFTASSCKQVEITDPVDGEFYLKLNDDSWSFEATLDFYAAPGSTTLPDGEYTLADTKAPGTFGSRSQIDLYSPFNTIVKFVNPITVKTVDGKKVIETTATMDDGRTLDLTFNGDITYLPSKVPVHEFLSCDATPFGNGNVVLFFQAGTLSVKLDVYSSLTAGYLVPGTYTVESSMAAMTIGTDPSYSNVMEELNQRELKSGTMTVSVDGAVYDIEMDFVLSDGSQFKGHWSGELPDYSPVMSYTASACSCKQNDDWVDGEFYLKLNNSSWSFDATLDLYAAPGSTTLPDGEYILADTKAPGTYSAKTQIERYTPSYAILKITNPITVKTVNGQTVIETSVITDEGLTINFTFTGDISYK